MQKLAVFRTLGRTLASLFWNFPWILFLFLPLVPLHSYFVILATPTLRIAFVNSALRPYGFRPDGDFSIQYLAPFVVVPGSGFEFPTESTIAVAIFELLLACACGILLHRRVAAQNGLIIYDVISWGRYFSYVALVLILAGVCTVFIYVASIFLPSLQYSVLQTYGQLAAAMVLPVEMTVAFLGCWLLISIGTLLSAIASNDQEYIVDKSSQAFTLNFWRTIGLIALTSILFTVTQLIAIVFLALSNQGPMPLGFAPIHAVQVAILVTLFFLQLSFTIIMVTHLHLHYREQRN